MLIRVIPLVSTEFTGDIQEGYGLAPQEGSPLALVFEVDETTYSFQTTPVVEMNNMGDQIWLVTTESGSRYLVMEAK